MTITAIHMHSLDVGYSFVKPKSVKATLYIPFYPKAVVDESAFICIAVSLFFISLSAWASHPVSPSVGGEVKGYSSYIHS